MVITASDGTDPVDMAALVRKGERAKRKVVGVIDRTLGLVERGEKVSKAELQARKAMRNVTRQLGLDL